MQPLHNPERRGGVGVGSGGGGQDAERPQLAVAQAPPIELEFRQAGQRLGLGQQVGVEARLLLLAAFRVLRLDQLTAGLLLGKERLLGGLVDENGRGRQRDGKQAEEVDRQR